MKVLIVGFDPGTRAGIAIIDTFGRIVFLSSKSNVGLSYFSKIISSHGKALVIATDRNPSPKSVEKLSKSIGAKLFVPEESLSVREKEELVKRFDIKIKNDHERDALSAAVKAYKSYANLLRKVYLSISSLGLNERYNEIVENLIMGKADNIDEAINLALSNKKEISKIKPTLKVDVKPKEIDKSRLEKDIEILKRFNQNLIKENAQLVEMLNKSKKSDDNSIRIQLEKLRKFVNDLIKYRRMEIKGYVPVIEIEKPDLNLLDKLNENMDLYERVILVKTPSNLQTLNEYGIKAALVFSNVDRSKLDFPVIVVKESDIKEKDGIKYIDKDCFEQKIKDARKEGLKEWVKEYKKRRI
ncbi:MAG: DUF460 domain-containing protein [Candidatus Aenigmatarchaeota archaeon]|nr:DUF460 domain-containing protein [Candidatus Aenigmarchaeota archaeon]